ncbi:hypothetical protein EJ03DRAFT_322773, partial [Teratosphaeria nubilosa]
MPSSRLSKPAPRGGTALLCTTTPNAPIAMAASAFRAQTMTSQPAVTVDENPGH